MPEKKDQHFVPQMYFRNFSDNGKSIGGYVLSNRKFVKDMPISGICKRPYLYGDDLQIETWFSGLETKWSPILKKIIRHGNLDLTTTEWKLLLEFIFLSDARTGYTADISNDFMTKICQTIIMTKRNHGDIDYANFTDEQIKNQKIGMTIPNAGSLRAAKDVLQLFGDLTPSLINNHTSRPFITSDNPVVKYNYLFTTRNYHLNYGYGHLGILVFLPISPHYCLMTYDPSSYKVSSVNNVVEIKASNQIIELNKLFATNAKSAIYFHNSAREWVIEGYTHGLTDTSKDFNNHILQNESGDYIIQFSSPSIFKRFKLDFININPHMLHMDFPTNLGGPIRPAIRELQRHDDPIPNLADSRFHYLPQFD